MLDYILNSMRVMPFTSFILAGNVLGASSFLESFVNEGPSAKNFAFAGVNALFVLWALARIKYVMPEYNKVKEQIEKEGFSEEVAWREIPHGAWAKRYAVAHGREDEYHSRMLEFKQKWRENADKQTRMPLNRILGVVADDYVMERALPNGGSASGSISDSPRTNLENFLHAFDFR